jgi:tetratricopeptide (TPR) repeat protein
LNVRAVLVGRVVQRGEEMSISAELVDSTDGRHVWGRRYQRDLAFASSIQQEIADDISEKLRLRLTSARRRSPAAHAPDAEAYRHYLKGRYYWNKRPAQGMVQKAIEYFEQATEQDPKFAPAYVGLADCYNALGRWESGAMAPKLAFPQATSAASRALRLDDTLAEAHSALAYVSMHYDWDWPRAGQGFERALKLNPNSTHAHHWYAHYLMMMGRIEEALSESLRILELDPLDVIINVHLAWHYYLAHQFPEAADAARKTLELEPHSHWGYFFLGWAYEQMRMFPEAIEALEKSVALSGGSPPMKAALGHAYGLAGDQSAALKVIQELKELSQTRYISSYEIGLIYAALKDDDEAFACLNHACDERSGWLPHLNAEPRLSRLRSDPRFVQLANRVGVPR